ncbi:MAG: hypothetical protein JKX85_03130 [Phycisphaeraceae bacterium]|nr:hypothetical protein [Phycisphaeraceae bacterium]
MSSPQNNSGTTQERGMSNIAVLAIGLILGLVGAGAFIMITQKEKDSLPTPTVISQDAPATQAIAQPTVVTDVPTPPATVSANPVASKALTQEEIKQVMAVKQMLDKALLQERLKVDEAVKAANAISDGKPMMTLDQPTLQKLSVQVKLIADAEYNFTAALGNVDKALVQLMNKTSLTGENKLKVARGYIYQLSPQSALVVRKANLARWGAFQKFVDFLANNFGKWKFDAEKKNTQILDESLSVELKTVVTNLNTTTAAVKQAEAGHIKIIKQRLAQVQQAQKPAPAPGTTEVDPATAVTPVPASGQPAK